MATDRSFLSILNKPFQWPKPGDKALVKVDDPFENARVVTDGYTRVAILPDAYKKAADLLVEACQEKHWDRDFLVFPIIFNYRQFLELSLKYQLQTFGPHVGVEPNWKWHNLEKLWE